LLNKLIIKPLIANKKILQIEIPLTDVAIIGKEEIHIVLVLSKNMLEELER